MPTPDSWSSSPGLCMPNRDDCTAWELSGAADAAGRSTFMAEGGHRGTGLVTPHRRERRQAGLTAWKQEHRAVRDCRLGGDGVHHVVLGIARSPDRRLHNLALAGWRWDAEDQAGKAPLPPLAQRCVRLGYDRFDLVGRALARRDGTGTAAWHRCRPFGRR